MSKELDYLDKILKYQPLTLVDRTIIECIKEKLQRLESIENAKPSEALEYFKKLKNEVQEEIGWYYTGYVVREQKIHKFDGIFDIIEPSLLKAQEQEKVLKIIFEKSVDVFRFKKLDFNTFNQLQRSCKLPELTQDEFELLKKRC